jgi:hypothetical protein
MNGLISKVFIALLLILEISRSSLSLEVGQTDSDSLGFPQILPLSISKKSQIKIHWRSFTTLLLAYPSLEVAKCQIMIESLNKLPTNKRDFIIEFWCKG